MSKLQEYVIQRLFDDLMDLRKDIDDYKRRASALLIAKDAEIDELIAGCYLCPCNWCPSQGESKNRRRDNYAAEINGAAQVDVGERSRDG